MKQQILKFLSFLAALFLTGAPLQSRANQEIDEVVAHTGLSGSYLAARVAASDNDDLAAVSFLEKSRLLDPTNNRINRNLFHAYLASGRIEKAVVLSRDIIEEDSNGHIITIVNGIKLIHERSWAKAIDTLSSVNGSDLDNMIVGIIGAWAKHGNGQTEEALKQIDAIDGANWMDMVKYLHRGLMLSASGNDAAAVDVLQKAVEIKGAARFLTETYIDAIDALARAYQRLDKKEKALGTIKMGTDIFPNHPTLHAMKEALDNGKPAGLLIANPQQGAAEFFYNLGNAIGREGGTPFAQIYLQLAKYLYPQSAPISISLASVFQNQKNPKRANEFYAQIDASSPFKRRALLETAINMDTLKKVEEAVTILRDLIEAKPADLVPYMTLGRLLNKHERYREAADIFDKAIARVPTPKRQHWDMFYRRAISFERLKEWDKAEASFKKALELNPNRATVLNYLGYSWVDQGIHLEEGLNMIRKAVKLRPDAGFIVDSLGWAYYRLKRYEDAVVELEKAIVLLPQDPVVNDHLGDAYWQTGRKLEAKFQWQHALDAKPEPGDEVIIRKKLETGMLEVEKPAAKSE
ncbi:MAG: tetratricopeptide repeat protein [Hyphomicrobiales bacterium]|nr:tetratricopeptide repeat protein [Hyphomicrobiales bacterium]